MTSVSFKNAGSKPVTALVTPKWLGGTYWNFCEAWVNYLARAGMPFRAFHVGDDPAEIAWLFSELAQNPPELVLLPCGDHHSYHLHNSAAKRAFWQGLKSRTLCYCMERIVNSPFPDSLEKTGSAIEAFDGFLYVDELAKPLFEEAGKPSLWTTQFSDAEMFHPRVAFAERTNQVYFRATLSNFGLAGVYSERRALVLRVMQESAFVIHQQLLRSSEFAEELARQRFVLRAASNCPGYVESTLNALASGCVVFHHKLPAEEVQSAGLLEHGRDFLEYDPANPDELIRMAHEATTHWPDYEQIAEAGRQAFLERFTVGVFMERLFHFADTQLAAR